MNIAGIVEEGERLETEHDRAVRDGFDSTAHALWDEKCSFWDDHARTLLAVCRAAVEWEKSGTGDYTAYVAATAAMRAAVRGDAGGEKK